MHAIAIEATATMRFSRVWLIFVAFLLPAKTPIPCATRSTGRSRNTFPNNHFGIIAKGEHRVINEFQNGDIYMIEKNKPIDFVGEVTILPITAARGFFDLSAARLYLKAGGADGH